MAIIEPNQFCQIALVVRDIEKTARHYAELFGVDVPDIWTLSPAEESPIRYKGQPTATRAKLCVFHVGPIVLELTEPDEHPSSWKQFLEEKGEGVHHIGFMVKDREAVMKALEEKDIPERLYGEYPGGNYTFVDSEEKLGVLLNIKYES